MMPALIELQDPTAVLASAGHLSVSLASSQADVDRALALRFQVFAGELGARTPKGDRDEFDDHCEHLIVIDRQRDLVVGTYRLLSPQGARQTGGLYSDREFDLSPLDALRPTMIEMGRSCVHPDYRSGTVIMLLWSGLGHLFSQRDYRYVVGCASVSMADGGQMAANLYRSLAASHMAPAPLQVRPRQRLQIEDFAGGASTVPPPLLKGYLRAGGKLLGEPHQDPEFGCADFPMMLDLVALNIRYQRRFLPN